MKNTFTAKFSADDKVIPILFPSNLIRWLEKEGYDREALITDTGLKWEEIDSADVRVTMHQHRQLVLNALRITDNPHLGLYFGRQIQFTGLGLVGIAAISSESLMDTLQAALKYMTLSSGLFNAEMYEKGDKVHIIYTESFDLGPIRQFIYEGMLGCIHNIFTTFGIKRVIQGLNSQQTPDYLIRMSIREPEGWKIHEKLLKADLNIAFDQEINEYIIPTQYLQQKSILADAETANLARKICDEQLSKLNEAEDFISRIKNIFQKRTGSFPSLDETASEICVSPRTLRRELKKSNTTYQSLLDDVRKIMAIKLLKTSSLTIHEIALKLGYKEPTNFSRAFKKWTEKSPGNYRNKRDSA